VLLVFMRVKIRKRMNCSLWRLKMIWVKRLTLVLMLAGCASTPIVDQAGVDQEAYEADLKECQYYADQVNSGQIIAASSALTGLFGGLLSMAVGDESSAKKAAGAGVTAGGAKGLAASEAKKAKVARQCLRSRGYIVYD
jgi:outer membrane lipoprotein SlyB